MGRKSSQSEGWVSEDTLFTELGVTEAVSAEWNTEINWDGSTTVSCYYFLIVLQMFERQIKGQAVTGFCTLQFKSVGRKVFSKISQNFTA